MNSGARSATTEGTRRRFWPLLPGLVLAAGLLATWSLRQHLRKVEERETRTHFDSLVKDCEDAVRNRMTTYIDALRGGASLFAASQKVERQEWKAYVDSLAIMERYPGINGMGWVARVTRDELPAYVERMREEGAAGFQIKSVPDVEPPQATDCFVISQIEPLGENGAAVGLDVGSEVEQRTAAEHARDTGQPAMTPKIILVQDDGGRAGFHLYVPVYRHGAMTQTPQQRRNAFEGWVYASFITENFFQGVLGRREGQIHLQVYDGEKISSERLIYESPLPEAGPDDARKHPYDAVRSIELAGRVWTIQWWTGPDFMPSDSTAAAFVGITGLLLSCAVSGLVWSLQTTGRRASAMAEKRTAELNREKQSLERSTRALKKTQQDLETVGRRFQIAVDSGGIGVWEYNLRTNSLVWDEQMLVLYGYTPKDFPGAYEAWSQRLHPEDKEPVETLLQAAIRGEKAFDTEYRAVLPDGQVRHIKVDAQVLADADGKPVQVIGVNYDITNRKQAEEAVKESRESIRRLIDSVVDYAIFTLDSEGRVASWNSGAERIKGYEEHEILGTHVSRFYPPEAVQEGVPQRELEIAKAEGRCEDENWRVRKDGSRYWASVVTTVLRDETGRLQGYSKIIRDITARRRAEQRFRLVVESSPYALVGVNDRGQIIFLNERVEEWFGYSREELMGKPIEILVPEEFRDQHPQYVAEYFRNPTARPMGAGRDLRAQRKDGSEFPVEIGLSSFVGEEGIVVLAYIVDITERRRAEQRFRLVVESSPYAFVGVNDRGRIVLLNERTEEWFGYSRDELLGQQIEILVPQRFRDQHPGHVGEYFGNPTARPMGAGRDLHAVRKDGSEFPVEIGLSSFVGEEGIVVLAYIVDITERKEAERLLRVHTAVLEQLTEDLKKRNEELDEFTYVASHDLQEPLRKLVSFSSLLPQDLGDPSLLSERAAMDLKYITDAAKRMKTLVQDLLNLSRTGRSELSLQTVSLNRCVKRAVESLEYQIQQTGATVTWDDLPEVRGDATLITQLFQNLLGNAIKYCAERPIIHVTVERGPGGPVFGVKDNGIGIPKEYCQQIFAPFKRLHNREQYEGTGIGLAICRKSVERHGGKIWVESEPGRGSHFRFTLGAERKVNA